MITLRPTWEWDVAAGTLILSEAGGTATTQRGDITRFNNPHPQLDGLVAAGGVHAPLMSLLA
jgi:myo-inositol-1(or 4)-monophosphatase